MKFNDLKCHQKPGTVPAYSLSSEANSLLLQTTNLKELMMKLFKKVLAGVAVAATLATSTQASADTVQGISIDSGDFTSQFNFRQTFSGTTLTGLGEVYSINGTSEITNSLTGGSYWAPGRELTVQFGGFTQTNIGTVANPVLGFTNGWLKVYSDSNSDFVINGIGSTPGVGDTSTDVAKATNSDFPVPFLELTAVSNRFFSFGGGYASGMLEVVWDVVGGAAAYNFDTDSIVDFISSGANGDLTSRASATFASGFTWTQFGGNGQLDGQVIPEPESLALVGLGLLGLVAARRRKIAK